MIDSYNTISSLASGTYSELRSKFLAFAVPVRSAVEALEKVAEYQRVYFDARHVCWAYRLGPEGEEFRANDNGEPSGTAGKPILGQLVSAGLSDVLLVVVRYFGGVKLGTSGLIVAYRTAAQEAIGAAKVVERLVEEEHTLTFTYDRMNMVMRMVSELQPRILSQDYTADGNVVMNIAIRLSLVDKVRSAFIVNGESVIKIS